jgi:hypothetical protein
MPRENVNAAIENPSMAGTTEIAVVAAQPLPHVGRRIMDNSNAA